MMVKNWMFSAQLMFFSIFLQIINSAGLHVKQLTLGIINNSWKKRTSIISGFIATLNLPPSWKICCVICSSLIHLLDFLSIKFLNIHGSTNKIIMKIFIRVLKKSLRKLSNIENICRAIFKKFKELTCLETELQFMIIKYTEGHNNNKKMQKFKNKNF